MARLFDDSDEYIDESMLAIEEITNLNLLEKHGCFTIAQCAALLCLHNGTDRADGSDEDMGTYIMLAFNDIRLGKLQVLHPETLLPWIEYMEMLKAGMYCDDVKELFPMITAGWLVRIDECGGWCRSKGFNFDMSVLKSELEESMKEAISKFNSTPKDTVINKGNYHSSDDDSFSEEECLLFDPLTKKQIEQLFTAVSDKDWEKFFDKALRNGLASARHGEKPYKYNPASVANWLNCEGKYRPDALARILSKNLPARSRQHRDSFLECRGLLDEN